jgi:hypothetical protein
LGLYHTKNYKNNEKWQSLLTWLGFFEKEGVLISKFVLDKKRVKVCLREPSNVHTHLELFGFPSKGSRSVNGVHKEQPVLSILQGSFSWKNPFSWIARFQSPSLSLSLSLLSFSRLKAFVIFSFVGLTSV